VRTRAFVTHALSLVQADHGLGQRVVVALTDGPDRGHRPGVVEPTGVPDRGVLGARVAVVDYAIDGLARTGTGPQRHLQGVQG
jgi:hypothetical protein